MSNLQIVLANGDLTETNKLRSYFDTNDTRFTVSLEEVWPSGYARKDSAIKHLYKNFGNGIDFRVSRIHAGNIKGGRPSLLIMLTRHCAERMLANGRRVSGVALAQRKTYFILCKEANAIKIGMAADVSTRLASLQVGNPFELRIVLILPVNIETKMHKQFNSLRLRYEWFSFGQPIIDFIDQCKSGALLSELL